MVGQLFVGDPHHFGQRVQCLKRKDCDVFCKPRSVKIEGLFLSEDTPLKFLKESGFPCFGKVESISSWHGHSNSYLQHKVENINGTSQSYSFNSGRLLALCLLYGITDLHFENILICQKDGQYIPQPVDIESLFWKCKSGIETLLYPSSLISEDRCGFAANLRKLDMIDPIVLIDSFLYHAKLYQKSYADDLADLFLKLKDVANRVILRPTRVYRDILNRISDIELSQNVIPTVIKELPEIKDNPLIKEEWQQLLRGDIPYFFYEIGNSQLLYHHKLNQSQNCDPKHLMPIFENSVYDFETLTSHQHQKTAISNTLAQLSFIFLKRKNKNVRGNLFRITNKDFFLFESDDYQFNVAQ